MADKVAFDEARAYFIVLNKRRGLILTCATVGLLTAALHNYTTRPVYEANAQLLIDWRTPNVLPHQELVDRRPIGGGRTTSRRTSPCCADGNWRRRSSRIAGHGSGRTC